MKLATFLLTCVLVASGCVVLPKEVSAESADADQRELVVLMHGLGRSNSAMWLLASRLEKAGYEVHRVGYSSLNKTPQQITENITKQINDCCNNGERKVNFVGHSLGGLLIRAYLQDNQVSELGRVVLIGTPNQGTPVVDHYRESWWMDWLGPTTAALGTGQQGLAATLNRPYYPVGVIAGNKEKPGHEHILPGKDDGLVTVESTRLEGMSDFIVLNTSHSYMRYDEDVARQTVSFLRTGRFVHDTASGLDQPGIALVNPVGGGG